MVDDEAAPLLKNSVAHNSYATNGEVKTPDAGRKVQVSWWRRRKQQRGLAKYNDYQQRLQRLYLEDDQLFEDFSYANVCDTNNMETARRRRKDGILASITFALNILLLFSNATASVLSGSLSIISTFIDSLADTTSGILIMLSSWAIKNTNTFNYPRGRTRLELVAVLVCSTVMGIANVMMIMQSIQSVLNQTVHPDANVPTVALILSACMLKAILLFVCCRHGTPSSRILALDQRNDILTSTVALCGAYIGDKYWLYADPIGAVCICTFIAISWFRNAFDNVPNMVGKRAQQENLSRIIRICVDHDPHIKCLDHVMVYHTGPEAIVEVHIVLDEQLPLRIAHDVIESLTKKLSALPFVERAFVHGDYRCDGDWQL
uniref:Cation efflux protein cytoplasmic domain-containing protein n=2 Tax=Parascaris TaxID=6254 RepID=A0A915BF25_PARUN